LHLSGATDDLGSGKTYSLCVKALQLALANPELPGIMCEPVAAMIGRVLVPTMNALLYELNIAFNLNKSEGSYDIDFGDGNPRKIWLLSSENYGRAAGISASWFGVDECDLMKKNVATDAVNMLVSRLTRGNQMQGVVVSTPEGYNFCYDFFEENAGDDRRLIRASTYDNPFIDPSYFENMAKTHTAQQLEAYLKGYFINLTTGQVYHAFDRHLNHTDKTINDVPTNVPLHLGIDFNVNVMATTVNIIDNSDRVFQINELSGSKNTESRIKTIKQLYPGRPIIVYPDATGNSDKSSASISDIAMLRNAGFDVKVKSVNPRIKDRINAVNAKLCNARGERTFFINTKICKQTTKSLEQQGYDPKTSMPDKSSGLDHFSDSVGYLFAYRYEVKSMMNGVIYKGK
jgi:hypothetical protein